MAVWPLHLIERKIAAVVVFSCVESARREGFEILEFNRENRMFILRKEVLRGHLKLMMCALAHGAGTGHLPPAA